MKLSLINPHIRYASVHYNLYEKPYDSICYDCRLFYAQNCTGSLATTDETIPIAHNTAIYLPPGTQYHISLRKENADFQLIVMDFDLIPDFSHKERSLGTASIHNFRPEQVISYPLPEEFRHPFSKTLPDPMSLLTKCCDEFLTQNHLYRETSSALLKLFLLELIRDHAPETDSGKLAPILRYIQEHYSDTELTNEQIARIFNYHPYYLSGQFKKYTGLSLHQYLIQYRIKIAKKNLISTDDAIHVIAWKSGFHSVAYFIKLFREQVGQTPKAYRSSHIMDLF